MGAERERERKTEKEREREEIESLSLAIVRLRELELRILEQWYKSKPEEKLGKPLLTEKGDERRKAALCPGLSARVQMIVLKNLREYQI